MDPDGAEVKGRGRGGGGAEEGAKEQGRGRGGVGGGAAVAARRGAGRAEQPSGAEEQGEGRCVCFCSVSVGDILVAMRGKALYTRGKAGFASPNCNGLLESALLFFCAQPQTPRKRLANADTDSASVLETRNLSCSRSKPNPRPCLVETTNFFSKKDECMHEILNEIYLRNLFTDGCNFSRRI